jgi:hypothetical protein
MGTTTIEGALVLKVPVELLGPGSEYEKRHNALKTDIQQLVLDASKIVQVTAVEELETANNAGRVLQASKKEVESFYKPLKQQVDAFKAPLLMHEKEFAGPIDVEMKRLGGLITAYNQEVEKKRQEAERVAREEAEKAAREEQLARAIELDQSGDAEAAAQVLDEPIMATPVVIQQEAPVRMAGQVSRMTYSATVMDFRALLRAVVEGKAPLSCVVADDSYLNSKARLEKDGFAVPGVRLNRTPSTNFRS